MSMNMNNFLKNIFYGFFSRIAVKAILIFILQLILFKIYYSIGFFLWMIFVVYSFYEGTLVYIDEEKRELHLKFHKTPYSQLSKKEEKYLMRYVFLIINVLWLTLLLIIFI